MNKPYRCRNHRGTWLVKQDDGTGFHKIIEVCQSEGHARDVITQWEEDFDPSSDPMGDYHGRNL